MRDLLHAARQLVRSPGFTLAAILSLALGIGANTAIFSLLDALMLRPLPVRDPQQLVRIGSLENNGMTFAVPGPALDTLRKDSLLNGICGVQTPLSTAEINGVPIPLGGHSLTGDCYQTLGINPAIGRLFTLADDIPNGARVVVLDYGFWQRQFGGNPHILGQSIRIEGVPFTIIGVTERRFHGLLLGFPPAISFPISREINPDFGDTHPAHVFYWADVFARLKPGVTPQQLEAHLRTKWRRLLDQSLPMDRFKGAQRAEHLAMPPVVSSGASGLDYTLRDHFRNPLAGLLAISILVLLVSCINVANLLLARGLQRRRDIAVRLALGAARWQILRQLLAESVLLIVGAITAALAVAFVSDRLLLAALGKLYSGFSVELTLDVRVLLFTSAAAVVALLLFGVLPAWQTSDVQSADALKGSSRSVAGAHSYSRRILISAQVALTLVLVMGASLFIQTLRHLRDVSLGFATEGVLDAQLLPLPGGYSKAFTPATYYRDMLDRMRSIPGVQAVSLSGFSPLFSVSYEEDIHRLDIPNRAIVQAPAEFVSDGFLQTMRIPLLEGHDFQRSDTPQSQRTAIVSRSLANKLFPNADALGRHIRFGTEPETQNLEIVGIAADARLYDPRVRDPLLLYLNLWQRPASANWGDLQLRYSGGTAQLMSAVRSELHKEGHQYTLHLRTIAEQRNISLTREKLMAALGTCFGALALTLAAVGLFGLLSFFVAMRTGEIGIRMALGAVRRDVTWLVIKEALLLVGTGLLIGLPLCFAANRALAHLLYGIAPVPVLPLLFSVAVLVAVAALAALLPVSRATAIDPMVALRCE